MIEAIQTLAAAHIDWSVGAGPIWLVTGLVAFGVPMTIVALADFFRGS